jgi:hypothetical protein
MSLEHMGRDLLQPALVQLLVASHSNSLALIMLCPCQQCSHAERGVPLLQFDYLKQHSLSPSALLHSADPSRSRGVFLLHLAAQNRWGTRGLWMTLLA